MGATFVDGFDGTSRESESNGFLEFGYVDALFLQVGVLALSTCGVELGSTSAIRVTSTLLRTFICNWAFLSHIGDTLH